MMGILTVRSKFAHCSETLPFAVGEIGKEGKMSAIVVMMMLLAAAAANAQVGWTVGKFSEKFPDSTATREMGECCLHTHMGAVDITCYADNDALDTLIHRVSYRPDSVFSRDDVERLLKANGPDLHWTSLGKEPDSVDWKGERGGKVLMRALWIFSEELSVFLSEE